VLTQFLLITAFPKIMQEFAVNSTEVQWLTTGYMLTAAILIPITAYFIDTFKTRNLMIIDMLLFFICILIGLVVQSFMILLIVRILHVIDSVIMIQIMHTILFLLYPRENRGFAMVLAGMVINVASAIGPLISCLLIKYFECCSLFYLTLPIAALIIIL